jgi:hypothetical protein
MKSSAEFLYGSCGRYWNAIQFSILAGIFFYYFSENFILSESWEILTLRSIDDYAMQDSIHSMQKALLTGNWNRIFGCFDYAYGNAFWLLNSILLLPFYFINDPQTLIVIGRQISLLFIFSSIYIIGLIIDRIRPEAFSLKYPILIAIATAPMVSIIATKLHVNAQSIFFGILSFYLLIRDTEISKRMLILSAVFAGMAIGFKLTGIFMLPLLGTTVLYRLWRHHNLNLAISVSLYGLVLVFFAAACTTPALILFPFFMKELHSIYATFVLYRNMTNIDYFSPFTLFLDGLGFYLSPLSLLPIIMFFFVLMLDDINKKKFYTPILLVSTFIAIFSVICMVNKAPSYISTYLINIGFFIPLGLLGIDVLRVKKVTKIIFAYLIVASGILYGAEYRNQILPLYRFFEINKSDKVRNQLLALSEIREIISPVIYPVRILQDNTAIFPLTKFSDGVDVVINYGNLEEKSTWGTFDYIILNSKEYFGMISPATDKIRSLNSAELLRNEKEEDDRKNLLNKGLFYGRKYKLIYDQHGLLLYRLEVSKL